MSFQDFQDGHCSGHLGYQNAMILAILNLYVAPMPTIKFKLNPTNGLGEVIWRFLRWTTWRSSWIWERNDFNNSKPPCCPNAIHQVSAQSDSSGADVVSRFSRWPPRQPSCTAERNDFSNSESLCRSDASHQVSAPRFRRRCHLKNFQDGRHGGHLGYRNR